ncbi:MAG: hypothetical protein AMS21_04210 [Gemmatimonas sp. SG8_38_2]|nr:MAG: hypothetical protein AMS21_04210 [Gemmatimonas sp. SG8_38_2]
MGKRIWPLAVLLALVSAQPLAGQANSLDFVPFVGLLVPTSDLARSTFVAPPDEATVIAIRQNAGVQLGARLVAWWSRSVGWEGTFAYSLGTAEAKLGESNLCGQPDAKCDANVWYASSKILFRYAPQPYSGWALFGGVGLAVAGHVGDFWDNAQAKTDLGGVLDVGASYDLSRIFAIRVDLEDYIYQFNAKIEGDPVLETVLANSKWQNDLVFSAGLVIRISGV